MPTDFLDLAVAGKEKTRSALGLKMKDEERQKNFSLLLPFSKKKLSRKAVLTRKQLKIPSLKSPLGLFASVNDWGR